MKSPTLIADLHMHSSYSDGQYSVTDLASKIVKAHIDVVALTDHDTIDGVTLMCREGLSRGFINVPALEISTFDLCEVHILGYNLNFFSDSFVSFFRELTLSRKRRVEAMIERLNALHMSITMSEVASLAVSSISRYHIAQVLVNKGYEKTVQIVFDKWLAQGKPAFVPHVHLHPVDALEVIRQSGGISVLAHPVRLRLPPEKVASYVGYLVRNGLDGIEAYYQMYPTDIENYFCELARVHGLIVTSGGDFHRDGANFFPRPLLPATASRLGIGSII